MPPRKRQPAEKNPPPPLPGGYTAGEHVYFTGAGETFESGNKGDVNCYLTSVRRLRAASAATPPACAPHTRRCPRP